MTSLQNGGIYIIDPIWKLKKNGSNALVVKKDYTYFQYISLQPVDALILSFFNGNRTVDTIKQELGFVVGIDDSAVIEDVFNHAITRMNSGDEPLIIEKGSIKNFDTYSTSDFVCSTAIKKFPKRLEVPLSIGINLTNRCQTNCIYCYAERRKIPLDDELSLDEWKSILDQADDLGIDRIELLGGDMFARPDAVHFIEYLIKKDKDFFVSTKCNITDSIAKKLADAGFGNRTFQISMDSPDPETCDFLTGTKGYYQRAIRSINTLSKYGINVRAKGTMNPYNQRQGPELIKLWHKLGVRNMMLIDYGRSFYRHNDVLFCRPEDSLWLEEQVIKLRKIFSDSEIIYGAQAKAWVNHHAKSDPNDGWLKWEKRARCSAGSSVILIAPDGLVTLCEQMPNTPEHIMGDIRNQSILDIWNSPKMIEYIYPPKEKFSGTACEDCEHFDECHRSSGHCFRDALFLYGSRYMPVNCPKAPVPIRQI